MRKEKRQVYQQKKEMQNLIPMIWFLEKKFNLPSGTLLSAESLTNKWKQTVNFSNIPKKPFYDWRI